MPDWSGEIRRRLSTVRLPPEREAAIVDEVAQHLEDRHQTLLASGQPAAEAERRAWRELEGDDVLGRLLSASEPLQRPSLAGLEVALEALCSEASGTTFGMQCGTCTSARCCPPPSSSPSLSVWARPRR